MHCKHGHACNRITECAVRGFLVCIQTETFVFLLRQGSTDLPLEATRDIFHAGMMLVCIQTENFVFLWWPGSTDSPLEATREIFHAGMMQQNKLVYAWWWYCHPFFLHHSGSVRGPPTFAICSGLLMPYVLRWFSVGMG